MTIEMLPIESDAVEEIWPIVRERFERYCSSEANRDTVEAYWQELIAGKSQLWVVWDTDKRKVLAALVTEIYKAANGEDLAGIDMIEGGGRDKWIHLIKVIEDWAVSKGCTGLTILAKKSLMRLLDKEYQVQRYIVEKKLVQPTDRVELIALEERENGHL